MQRVATIAAIVVQHVEDASFLWSRRRHEIDGQILGEADIGRIDQRLHANIEGMLASGESAWKLSLARFFDYEAPAELFALSLLALHWGNKKLLDTVLDGVRATNGGIAGISGAIACTTRDKLRPFLPRWLDEQDPLLQALGLIALTHQRVDAGDRLQSLVLSPDVCVRTRAIRLAGIMRRRDLVGDISVALEGSDLGERLAAARAFCLLGEARHAYATLDKLARIDGFIGGEAIDIRLLATPKLEAKKWLQERLQEPSMHLAALRAIGVLGEVSMLPWLVEKMRDPSLAYTAGFALRDLIEADFNDADVFTLDPPSLGKKFERVEDFPLPIADKVEVWWNKNKGKSERFLSMRRLKLDAHRTAFADSLTPLVDWRRTRQYPAWM